MLISLTEKTKILASMSHSWFPLLWITAASSLGFPIKGVTFCSRLCTELRFTRYKHDLNSEDITIESSLAVRSCRSLWWWRPRFSIPGDACSWGTGDMFNGYFIQLSQWRHHQVYTCLCVRSSCSIFADVFTINGISVPSKWKQNVIKTKHKEFDTKILSQCQQPLFSKHSSVKVCRTWEVFVTNLFDLSMNHEFYLILRCV